MTTYARVKAEARGTMIIIGRRSDLRGYRSCPFSNVGVLLIFLKLHISKSHISRIFSFVITVKILVTNMYILDMADGIKSGVSLFLKNYNISGELSQKEVDFLVKYQLNAPK